jgi:outer membrane lipoprotein-sorting protein
MTRRLLPALLLVLAVVFGSGCIVRKLRISRRGASPTAQLATASLEDLTGQIAALDKVVQTINATADLAPSIGSVNKGEISEYQDLRAFVLISKPNMFRIIGQAPVVRSLVFDMTTDSTKFEIYFPTRNKLVTGLNKMERPSANKLENIRPQHLFDALVVHPVGQGDRAVLENRTDETDASYIVHILRGTGQNLKLARNLWFERVGLRLTRQVIFDPKGDIVSDARYDDYKPVQGVSFPHSITITRPADEYGIKLTVEKVELNKEIADEKFVLTPPAGTETFDMTKRPPTPANGAKEPK